MFSARPNGVRLGSFPTSKGGINGGTSTSSGDNRRSNIRSGSIMMDVIDSTITATTDDLGGLHPAISGIGDRIGRSHAEVGRSGVSGTSIPLQNRYHSQLFINTTGVEYEDVIPSSNRNSTMSSSRDLLSARSSSSTNQSVVFSDSNSGSTKFGVYVLPKSQEDFDVICRKKIGSSNGTSMCIKRNCTINHRGGDVASVRNGEIFVQKGPDVVFLEPKTHSDNITDEILTYWLSCRRKIEDWSTEFSVTNLTQFHEVLSSDDLKQGTAFADHARNHRSPGLLKISRYEDSEDTFVKLLGMLGTPRIRGDFNFMDKKRSLSDVELDDNSKTSKRKLSDEISVSSDSFKTINAKEAIDHIYKLLFFLSQRLDEKDTAFNEEVKILFSRAEMFHTDIGTRSTTRTDNWQVPTIWGSIASLAGAIDGIQKELNLVPSTDTFKLFLSNEFDKLEISARETVNAIIVDLEGRVAAVLGQKESELRDNAIELNKLSNIVSASQIDNEAILLQLAKGASVLKSEISAIRLEFLTLLHRGVSSTSSTGSCSNYVPIVTYDTKMDQIDKILNLINEKVSKLISEADGEMIKSFGLGIKDRESSEDWLSENLDDAPFGVIVDAHLVFEHLFYLVSDNEGSTLNTLHSIKKLSLSSMSQGLCLSSFEARVPKILSKSSNMGIAAKTKGSGTTHFDRIASYAVWDENYSGIRRVIKDQIRLFESGHIQLIYSSTKEDSRGRRVALQALQTSLTWIQDFIVFIDDTYKDCIQQSTFTEERAWELTTQLGRRIFIEIAGPRGGVNTAINISDNTKISKMLFWPLLQSHDVMKAYKDCNFTDHPTIAAEYLKFLTTNSGSDAIGELKCKIKSLQEENVASAKLVKSANLAANQAMNAVDEMQKKMREIEKRVTKTEQDKKR